MVIQNPNVENVRCKNCNDESISNLELVILGDFFNFDRFMSHF